MPHRVLIVGSGPAGLTAAIYAARGGLEPTVIAGSLQGGQLMTTLDVENYPGFPEGILGPDLVESMRRQAERFGTRFVPEDAVRVDFGTRPLRVWTDTQEFHAHACIVATGASPRWLDRPNEQRLRGMGVSSCATCDGAFFRGRPVCVVGGGDTAVEEALYLSELCPSVTIVHRRDRLRAEVIMQERLRRLPQVHFEWNQEVVDVLGDQHVEGIRLRHAVTGQEKDIPCAGVFVAIGQVPNTAFLRGQVELDERGYVAVRDCTRTSVRGVFVAGDVYDFVYQQAVTAAASGCKAAIDAARYLELELPDEAEEQPGFVASEPGVSAREGAG